MRRSPVYPGFSVHDELGLLVKAGLSPLEALQTSTLNAAQFVKVADSLGTLETGKLADRTPRRGGGRSRFPRRHR